MIFKKVVFLKECVKTIGLLLINENNHNKNSNKIRCVLLEFLLRFLFPEKSFTDKNISIIRYSLWNCTRKKFLLRLLIIFAKLVAAKFYGTEYVAKFSGAI